MMKEIKQSIAVRTRPAGIFEELLLWGNSRWWPPQSLMRFENLSDVTGKGTLYLQQVKLPLGPRWRTKNEIVDRENLYIKRIFLDGLFEGFEELAVLEDKAVSWAVYSFHYKVKGFFNRIIWEVLFKKLHIRNINLILGALRDYLELAK